MLPINNALLFFCFLIFPILSSSQTPSKVKITKKVIEAIEAAEAALLNKRTKEAEKHYLKILEKNPNYVVALRGLSVVYQYEDRHEESAKLRSKILAINPVFSRLLYSETAISYFRSGDYSSAEYYFKQFEEVLKMPRTEFGLNGEKERGLEVSHALQLTNNLQACKLAKKTPFSKYLSVIQNLGSVVNSKGDEYFPFLINGGSQLYFTRQGNKHNNENLFLSTKKNDLWSSPEILDATINTITNEGMASFTRDGRQLYFTACQRRNVRGTCDIQIAQVIDNQISNVNPVEGHPNSHRWESQACISCDGSTLFFASTREGGFGSTDIYWSHLQSDRTWSEPENLGPTINTDMDEEAPFITDDGKTLFFSSTGHLGLGEQDIFMSKLQKNGEWGVAINLGAPINTGYREIGFFLAGDGLTGFLSSDRPGGEGKMDIYQFDLKEALPNKALTYVEGFVKDADTNLPIQTVLYDSANLPIPTDEDGRFFRCLLSEELFDFSITENDYLPYQYAEVIPRWDNSKPYRLDIFLHPVKKVITEPIKVVESPKLIIDSLTVYFDFDKYALTSNAQVKLQEMVQKLSGRKIESLEILGFTDLSGTIEYNDVLSEKRANSVEAFLLKKNSSLVEKISVNLVVEGRGIFQGNVPERVKRKVEIIWTSFSVQN